MEQPTMLRRRPALSCIICRQRKLKCDRNDPCSRCVANGVSCSYRKRLPRHSAKGESRENYQRPLPPSSLGSSSALPLSRPSTVSRATEPLLRHEPSLPWTAAATAATELHGPSDLLGHGHVQSDGLPDLAGSSRDGQRTTTRRSGLQGPRMALNKTRMLRWSHWIGTAKEYETVVEYYVKFVAASTESESTDSDKAFQEPESRDIAVHIGELIQDCKNQARRIKISRPTRCMPSYQFDLVAPPRDISDVMMSNYFRSFESAHRILHIPTFRALYEDFWTQTDKTDTSVHLRVLLVIAIGSSLDEHAVADISFRSTIWRWVYAAQTWLSGPLEKDRLSIAGLQIHCLTLLAREIFSIGGDLIWVSTGSLMHSAMQMGLHRDPKHFSGISVLQAEVRRRLWATILEMTLQSSLDSALPTRISLDDFDTEAPSNIDDDAIDRSTDTIRAQQREVFTSTSIQILLLDSFPIRLRILQMLNDLHAEIAYADVLNLDSEIVKALQACNNFARSDEGRNMTSFHRNLLDYLIRRFLIPLHCPFASQARTNRIFNYSLEASLSASLALVSPEPDDSFSRLMTVGGGLFREGIRCASSIICRELLAKVEAQRSDGTLNRNSRQTEALKQAVSDMIVSSSERIRLGETNIKPHLFLNMILAQVEAIEKRTSCEVKIAKSAEESLSFCHQLISERAKDISSSRSANGEFTPLSLDHGQDVLGLDLGLDPSLGFSSFLPNGTFY